MISMTIIFLKIYEKLCKNISVIVKKNFYQLLTAYLILKVIIYSLKIILLILQKKIMY